MVLQSSGAISLNDIQNEFGGANPIGLNEYYRGVTYVSSNNTSVPASGQISLNNFYGAYLEKWWITLNAGPTTLDSSWPRGIAHSSLYGYSYVVNAIFSSSLGRYELYLTYYGQDGSIGSQFKSSQSVPFEPYDVADIGNNQVIIAAVSNNSSIALLWYNGSIYRARTLDGSNTEAPSAIIANTSNAYIAGVTNSTGGAGSSDMLVIKYELSTGNVLWQRSYGSSAFEAASSIAIDAAGNSYVSGYSTVYSSTYTVLLLLKYDTSGTFQWAREFRYAGRVVGNRSAITYDSFNNFIYVAFNYNSGTQNFIAIAKYTTAGVIQWVRLLGRGVGTASVSLYNGNDAVAKCICVDQYGFIYVAGAAADPTNSSKNDIFIVKYNTTGAVQWMRTIGTTADDWPSGIVSNNLASIIVHGATDINTSGTNYNLDSVTMKLPADGSMTGTYGSWTYKDASSFISSFTFSGYTETASSLTQNTRTFTNSTTSYTLYSQTYTTTKNNLPL